MIPYLFHIGRFYFNLYGLCIALGILVFLRFASKDPLAKRFLKKDELTSIILFCVVMGLIGGRIANIVQYPSDYHGWHDLYDTIAIWEGGLSVNGSIIALFITLPIYLAYKKLPIIPLLDLGGLYGALLQSIARFGCFFAGCCHGCTTTVAWAITYTHPESAVAVSGLLNIPIHPTQLYSSLMLFIIFIVIRYIARPWLTKPGQIFGLYLILSSAERFFNDFFREEHYQELAGTLSSLSQNQMLTLLLGAIGIAWFTISTLRKPSTYHTA